MERQGHNSLFSGVLSTSPVEIKRRDLPLQIIAIIVSFVDDIGDLARLTRTSRLLYYITLPKLYEDVTLRSYREIRYVDGIPEGYGSGSPFSMGLSGLISRNTAEYVFKFRLIGEWHEQNIDDYSKGRVPDDSVMLNLAARAAIDRMTRLHTFHWELNTKPLQSLYQGLATRPTLKSLVLRFPTTRMPRPTAIIPPLPSVVSFIAYDIDPLCFPDDISLFLLHARDLENFTLHFNPRMREMREESTNLMAYLGRCIAAGKTLNIKHMEFWNLFARAFPGMTKAISSEGLREVTMINSVGSGHDPRAIFLDNTWRIEKPEVPPFGLKMIRTDSLDRHGVEMIARFSGLERVYFISNIRKASKPGSVLNTPMPSPSPGSSSGQSPPRIVSEFINLASDYIVALQTFHGKSLRHVLFYDQWLLDGDVISRFLSKCPNLEQFGVAMEGNDLSILRRCIQMVPKVHSLRILIRPDSEFCEKLMSMDATLHAFALGSELWKPGYKNLKYIGLGPYLVFQCGPVITKTVTPENDGVPEPQTYPFRVVQPIPQEKVKHIEIWSMDTTEFALYP